VIDPESFHRAFCEKFPRFSGNMPHDVQEVVLELVDTFEKSLGVGFIQSIFNGTETQEVVYPGGVSKKESDLTLVVVHPEKQNETLDELLKRRANYHAFSGYIDDTGKEHNAAVTRTFITKYPSIMIISFDQYERKSTVRVPKTFENYILFGLVVHHGSTHGGHYTAFVKHKGVWRHTDDESIASVEPPELGEYYLAFYKKIST
jgi:ubiquitin C-terminal hydrolase